MEVIKKLKNFNQCIYYDFFQNNSPKEPFKKIRSYYNQALNQSQENIEAIAVSSYSKTNSLVDSRFVNLKFIDNESFIFLPIMIHQKQFNLKSISKSQCLFIGQK